MLVKRCDGRDRFLIVGHWRIASCLAVNNGDRSMPVERKGAICFGFGVRDPEL